MKLEIFIIGFSSLTASSLAFLKPESGRVFTSLASHPTNLSPFVKLGAGVFHLFINSYHYYATCLHTCTALVLAYDIVAVINHLSVIPNKSKEHQMRRLSSFASKYRAMTVLQANYAEIYRHRWLATELLCLNIMIVNVYQAVVFGSYRAMVLVLTVGAGFCFVMALLARVFEASRDMLGSWEREAHNIPRWGRIFLKSCRPVRLPFGGFFYVDRGLALTALSIVIENSASLILAHKQYETKTR